MVGFRNLVGTGGVLFTIVLISGISIMVNGTLRGTKMAKGLDALSNQKILKVIYYL